MIIKGIAICLAALTVSSGASAATIFGVDENNQLVSFDSATPGTFLSSTAITGVTSSLQGLDFRPLNNVLYGLGSDHVIYTINTMTGAASAVSSALNIMGSEFGFDFNPSIDRLRIVSNTNQNYVFNPNDGSLSTVTPVAYAAGDTNFGKDPDVTGLAYSSAAFGGSTQLYSIDTANDVLDTQANSAGTLATVGSLGVNLGSRTSFDISGSDAFAFNGTTLYRANLQTGALTSLGNTNRALFGIAIAAVPEPATWAMMLIGFGGIGFAMRRRAKVRTTVSYA